MVTWVSKAVCGILRFEKSRSCERGVATSEYVLLASILSLGIVTSTNQLTSAIESELFEFQSALSGIQTEEASFPAPRSPFAQDHPKLGDAQPAANHGGLLDSHPRLAQNGGGSIGTTGYGGSTASGIRSHHSAPADTPPGDDGDSGDGDGDQDAGGPAGGSPDGNDGGEGNTPVATTPKPKP